MLNSNTYFLLRSRPGQTYPSQLTTYYLTIHLLVQTSGNVNLDPCPPCHEWGGVGFRDSGRCCHLGPEGWWRWNLGFIEKQVLILTIVNEYLFFEYFELRVFYCVKNFRSNLQKWTLRFWESEGLRLHSWWESLYITHYIRLQLGENLGELNRGCFLIGNT